MKVNDIKVFNPDDAEVTDKLILNTEFVMKYITQRIQMDFSGKNKLFL